MPRIARKKSCSNIYHVMIRGINRQNIFEEDDDRLCFMKILNHCKEISGYRLYAFALMSNHIHLLIEPAGEPLSTVAKIREKRCCYVRVLTKRRGWWIIHSGKHLDFVPLFASHIVGVFIVV